MEPQPTTGSANTKLIIGVLIGCVIGLLLGMILGRVTAPTTTPVASTDDGAASCDAEYQAGFEAAREKLIERGYLTETPTEVEVMETTYLAGTVTGVSGNSLTIAVMAMDPLADNESRTVTVTNATEVSLLVPKTPEAMEADMLAFEATADRTLESEEPIAYPEPYTTKTITLAQIAVGSEVSVEATEVIPATGEITAASIEVMKPMVMEEPLPEEPYVPME